MQSVQRHAPTVFRVLLGLIFFVFGLNGFLGFIPQPPMEGAPAAFLGALIGTGYVFKLVKAIEVAVGLMLLTNRFVPLALTLLAPISVNIFLFHVVLAPPNPVIFLVLLGNIYLGWAYRDAFRPMLAMRVKPSAPLAEVSSSVAARAAA